MDLCITEYRIRIAGCTNHHKKSMLLIHFFDSKIKSRILIYGCHWLHAALSFVSFIIHARMFYLWCNKRVFNCHMDSYKMNQKKYSASPHTTYMCHRREQKKNRKKESNRTRTIYTVWPRNWRKFERDETSIRFYKCRNISEKMQLCACARGCCDTISTQHSSMWNGTFSVFCFARNVNNLFFFPIFRSCFGASNNFISDNFIESGNYNNFIFPPIVCLMT